MLVDDHYLVRMGLASIIALESDMTVCAEAATGEQALALFRIHNPDVTLIDQRLPGMTGSETTQKIRSEYPGARILVLSTYACDEEIYRALQCGAMGYLSKSVQREELTQAIRKAASGRASHHARSCRAARGGNVAVASLDARTRCAAPARRRQTQPGNRIDPRYHRGNGQAARQQYSRETRGRGQDGGCHSGAARRGIVQL